MEDCAATSPTALDQDDLFDILSILKPIEARWRELGNALRLRTGFLDSIQITYSGNLHSCLNKVIDEWLKRNYNVQRFGEPTWQLLAQAVRHEAGGAHSGLADEITRKYLPSSSPVQARDAIIRTQLLVTGSKASAMPPAPRRIKEVKETTDDACNVYENVDDDDDVSYYITFPTGGELMPPSCIFGQLHRSETLKLLQAKGVEGMYLLRDGAHKGVEKVLSIWHAGRCAHYKVFKDNDGSYSLAQEHTFRSIPALLQYYVLQSHLPRADFYLVKPYRS